MRHSRISHGLLLTNCFSSDAAWDQTFNGSSKIMEIPKFKLSEHLASLEYTFLSKGAYPSLFCVINPYKLQYSGWIADAPVELIAQIYNEYLEEQG